MTYLLILFHRHIFFFFNDTAPTEIYTLSLHDALPIFLISWRLMATRLTTRSMSNNSSTICSCPDRKSTRLNSSHVKISYAVFCLKKKKKKKNKNYNRLRKTRNNKNTNA